MTLDGIYPPIPTIFNATNGDVDRGAIAANVQRLMTTGLRGILALGSNGEAGLLDENEADAVVEAARAAIPEDRVLIVGTGRESTRGTIAACRRAKDRGATVAMVRTPSFFKTQMTPDALVAHYTAVADASPLPILLYNLPGPTGITILPSLVARLKGHENIVGMKETSPDLERLGQVVATMPARFRVFSGWAPVAYPAFVLGAAGAILAVANVLPDACVRLHDHARAGRHAEALLLQQQITRCAQLVSSIHGVPGLKVALDLTGQHGGPVRAPLQTVTPAVRAEIAAAFSELTS